MNSNTNEDDIQTMGLLSLIVKFGFKNLRPEYLKIRSAIKENNLILIRDWLSPESINKKIASEAAYKEIFGAISKSEAVILGC